ncbi:cellulase family glycosylhydrolase [Chitinophaga lutea]
MLTRKLFAGFLAAGMLAGASTSAQGFLRAEGPRIVNEKKENVLLRGIGLGGWMLQEGYMLRIPREGQQQYRIRERIRDLVGPEKTQAFYDAWLANHTTRADIDSMKAWGFNSVRLPMHFNLYTLPVDQEPVPGQHTWLNKGFAMTDSLLAWCKANGMYLILDLHAAPGGQGNDVNIADRDPSKPSLWDSRPNQEKTIALWRKLAERYRNEPWIGAYDILNEPNWGFTDPVNDKNGIKEMNNAPLRKLMEEITAAIREVDDKHIVIIEGNGWGNNYNGVFPPWDKNMVLSYHKYWNYNDDASIRHILESRDKYNIPVWLGETGENSNVWFTEAIRLLEKHNIGWSWWPLKKLGNNNPLEIPMSAGYQQLLDYWGGKGERPSAADAEAAVMQFAADTRIGRNIVHRDVIDAMIRQPHDAGTRPFRQHRINGTTEVLAVDYDLGINGSAYFDKDTANYRISNPQLQGGNKGRTYRNDGVDIRRENDGYAVTDIEAGEWLQYTIQVARTGTYLITPDAGGPAFSIWIDGEKTNGPVRLKVGWYRVRVQAEQNVEMLKSMRFTLQ